MNITVNNITLKLHEGAKVKDAILKYYSQEGKSNPKHFPLVEDSYGNALDSDGALSDGNNLFIKNKHIMKSSTPKLVLAALAIGLLFGCSNGKKSNTGEQSEKQAVIFAVNDMHAKIDGFPKLAYIVDSLEDIYPDILLVSAGDNQTGNPVNDQYPEKGWPVIDLMNRVGFDLSAVGNHEFDCSPAGFGKLTHKADFDFICANVIAEDSLNVKFEPYKIITLNNGLKLAFLGLLQVNPNGIPDTHPLNTKGFTFLSPFDTAPEYIYLHDSSDIFIALTHLGFETDVELAKSMPAGINLIIGGHSHTKVDKEQVHNGILITQASSSLRYGSLIKLKLADDGSLQRSMELLPIRDTKNENKAIRKLLDDYNDNPLLKEVIAEATDDFTSHEELGYLMADAQRAGAGADIALMNPGGVRLGQLSKGPISLMDVYKLDPFGNELVVTELTGNEIRTLMFAAYPIDDDQPIFPSGIKTKLTVDTDNNLIEVMLLNEDGSRLDMDKTYTVAMNSYMAEVYNYEHKNPGYSLYVTTADYTIDYLKEKKDIISYKGEKRVEVNQAY